MFELGTIWAYPTDTSFGLGVRADDVAGLDRLMRLKRRSGEKYFSLMVRDFAMLQQFAEIPGGVDEAWFFETPRTAILRPTALLPQSKYWPETSVAFRVCTLPDIAQQIEYPVTATSANISGKDPLFCMADLRGQFADEVQICRLHEELPYRPPSEIIDFTQDPPKKLR